MFIDTLEWQKRKIKKTQNMSSQVDTHNTQQGHQQPVLDCSRPGLERLKWHKASYQM